MKNIAIFASGNGTNAEKIINYLKDKNKVRVALVVSNKKDAYVLTRAKDYGIPTLVLTREKFYDTQEIVSNLNAYNIDLIVLAGFLWLVPDYLIRAFPEKMVNIHPALLPKFGGKGMYGKYVHQAVIDAGEKESGITIHYVNERYDEGEIIFQARCEIAENDTPETLAERIHQIEHRNYPMVIERLLTA